MPSAPDRSRSPPKLNRHGDRPPIYLDYNGTTPLDKEVADAMIPYMYTHFGNPSSGHYYGKEAKAAMDMARKRTAALVGGQPDEITFMGNGTETINHALRGLVHVSKKDGIQPTMITQQTEHVAVLETVKALEAEDLATCRYLPVDSLGCVSLDAFSSALEAAVGNDVIVSVMHSNNETGTLQPIRELTASARKWQEAKPGRRCWVHCDASQSLGKVPVNVIELDVDLMTIAGHKLYAPKGVGALYSRAGRVSALPMFIKGAGQEHGRRASTENVIHVVALGKACEIAQRDLKHAQEHLTQKRDRLYAKLVSALGTSLSGRACSESQAKSIASKVMHVNGPTGPGQRLPNTLSVSFRHVAAPKLLADVGDVLAASAGAACHSDGVHMSHVLKAMGADPEWAMGTVRLSVGRGNSEAEIDEAADALGMAVTRLLPKAFVDTLKLEK